MKKNKGITLIALVITIIVLVILAGTTIALVVEDDGVAKKAGEAKIETQVAEILQEADLITNQYILDNNGQSPVSKYIVDTLVENGKIKKEQILESGLFTNVAKVSINNKVVEIKGATSLEEFRKYFDIFNNGGILWTGTENYYEYMKGPEFYSDFIIPYEINGKKVNEAGLDYKGFPKSIKRLYVPETVKELDLPAETNLEEIYAYSTLQINPDSKENYLEIHPNITVHYVDVEGIK